MAETPRVAVVTGASSGVGRAVARAFVERGWAVVGLARGAEKLAETRVTLGDRFDARSVDVRRHEDVARAFEEIGRAYGAIDLLVNNAAVFRMGRFEDFGPADVDAVIDTNLKGTIFCTMSALPWLRTGSARVVNIGSVAGTHGIKGQALYCASKYGVDGFAEALNQELVARGVLVTTVSPGGIDTPLWDPETNPYPGGPGTILSPADVVSMVAYVADLPPHVVLKKVVMFPSNEWH